MPKGNQKGGKKHKKGKKESFQEKQLIYKDPKEDQEYAKVTKVNGSGRYNLFCFDGKDRLGICAGNIKRRVRLSINDIVLVALWDFQDNKCSIVHKYEEDEVQKLKIQGEFPENIRLEEDNHIPISSSLGQKTSNIVSSFNINPLNNFKINYQHSLDENLDEYF